ncbi:MAG: class II fumarate hydratase [Kyrpidia tusciae]|nr:class II fumarate hydratase [Kyrpidia tusciae]MBE3552304.1 class II fumarate hydratase [Kyrpidia tusciae]
MRKARDSLGEVMIDDAAYYGAQTARAVKNFPISGMRLPREFIRAQALIKGAAALANRDLGRLKPEVADAIVNAAQEVAEGRWDDHFVVDVYQAGAGTSQNMNANEVIANRACEWLGAEKGRTDLVHPNDHVNMGQSTNDTIHTALHLAAYESVQTRLIPSVSALIAAFRKKQEQYKDVVKLGRTHLQDAVPIRVGQEIGGWAGALEARLKDVRHAADGLLAVGIGGTAVGTGLNAGPQFPGKVLERLREWTGYPWREPEDRFAFMQNTDAVAALSGSLRGLALSLGKIADDLRLLSSGPRGGLAEFRLPAVQPGSSIMPGKVNPVMAEMMNMIVYQVIGCDACVAAATAGAQLELNVMMPVISWNVLHAIRILGTGCEAFRVRCVEGLEVDQDQCRHWVERSTALATALNPVIGYDRAAELAKRAYQEGRTVREVAEASGWVSAEDIHRLMDLHRMTDPTV